MAASATQNCLPKRNRMLVVSADPLFRKRVMTRPTYAESHREEAVGGAHAIARLGQFACDQVLLDRHLPDLDSREVAALIQERYPGIAVEFVDSHSAPPALDEPKACEPPGRVAPPGEADLLEPRDSSLVTTGHEEEPLAGMIGSSRAIRRVYRLARMVAKRDTTVLITGETGTGKELVAEAIHQMSHRCRHPFVAVNCAAIPEGLFEAELFGHARGAFTGATQSRPGRLHLAQGGTLFFDEIGDLPLSMQVKLLRFLQNGEVQRLGSSDTHHIDVRIICATNVRLADLVQAKQFRQDLFYRMAVFPIPVPPLRERSEDVGALADHFLAKLSAGVDAPAKCLTLPALELLQRTYWAGNVRELQHALERVFILSGNESQIGPACFG